MKISLITIFRNVYYCVCEDVKLLCAESSFYISFKLIRTLFLVSRAIILADELMKTF